jgi:hypothetical protein
MGEEEGREKGWEVMEAMNGLDGEALSTNSATHVYRPLNMRTTGKTFQCSPPRVAWELDGHLRWRRRHADGVEHLRLVDGSR